MMIIMIIINITRKLKQNHFKTNRVEKKQEGFLVLAYF